jgi:hypothetical protein
MATAEVNEAADRVCRTAVDFTLTSPGWREQSVPMSPMYAIESPTGDGNVEEAWKGECSGPLSLQWALDAGHGALVL